ncbi:hypothetical protein [Streptomyces hypolithicus]
MDPATRPSGASDAGPSDWCDWHKGPSGTAKHVQSVDRPSGSPFALYACAPCREQRGLTAVEQPATPVRAS